MAEIEECLEPLRGEDGPLKAEDDQNEGIGLPEDLPERNVLCGVCLYILVTEMCERLAFYGFSGTLLSFFTSRLQFSSVFASEMTALFAALVHLTPIFGGYIADQYLGRYHTIGLFLTVYLFGLGLVVSSSWPTVQNATLALVGLLIGVAAGAGGIKANVVTFGADQFDLSIHSEAKQQEKFFGYFYMTINIGAVFSFAVLSNLAFNPEAFSFGLIPHEYGYFATYVIPTFFVVLAAFVYYAGTNKYTIVPLNRDASFHVFAQSFYTLSIADKTGTGKLLLRVMLALLVSASAVVISFFIENPKINFLIVVAGMGCICISAAVFILFCRDTLWIDTLQLREQSINIAAVSNVRDLILLLPYFGTLVIFFIGYTQMSGNFQLQACQMNMYIGSVAFSPAFLNVFDCATIIVAVPILNNLVYPMIKTRYNYRVTVFDKMFIGFLLMSLAMFCAGVLEEFRVASPDMAMSQGFENGVHTCCSTCAWSLSSLSCQQACGNMTVNHKSNTTTLAWETCKFNSLCGGYKPMKTLTVKYQLIVYCLVGLSETFSSVAAYDLFYNEVGKEIRSVSQGVNLLTYAFGGFATGGLNGMMHSWIPNDLNTSGAKLNIIFYSISVVTVLMACLLRRMSTSYVFRSERNSFKLIRQE